MSRNLPTVIGAFFVVEAAFVEHWCSALICGVLAFSMSSKYCSSRTASTSAFTFFAVAFSFTLHVFLFINVGEGRKTQQILFEILKTEFTKKKYTNKLLCKLSNDH